MASSSVLLTALLATAMLAMVVPAAHAFFKDKLHPAVVFPVQWAIVLLMIMPAASWGMYGVHPAAAALFLAGTLIFLGGAKLGDSLARRSGNAKVGGDPWNSLRYRPLAWATLALHVVLLPVWWREMVAIADGSTDLLVVGFQVRYKTALGDEVLSPLVGNYLVLGFIIMPILAVGAFRRRLPVGLALAACLPWAAANLVANGRSTLVQLALVLIYLRATEARPINFRAVAVGLLGFFTVFGGGVLLVAKGNTTVEDGLGPILLGVVTNLGDYALQGPVLFSRYFTGEVDVVSTWDALKFPCTLLQMIGQCTPGEQHQEFSEFGRFDQFGNVYTIYFSILPKYGAAGLLVILGFYGAWAALHHRRHRQRVSMVHSLLAGYLISATVLSVFADMFAPNLNFLIKLTVVTWLLQRLLREPSASIASPPISVHAR